MKSKIVQLGISIIFFSGVCSIAAWLDPGTGAPWYGIVPPLLAIIAAAVTKNVFLSLGLAVLVGGLLTQGASLTEGIGPWLTGVYTSVTIITEVIWPWQMSIGISENVWVLGFVFIIFAMVEVLIRCGGFQGVIRLLMGCIKGRRSAEAITALLGMAIFIDDYTSAIVVGSAMRPISDRFNVSREKLAFLVDGTSAPIAGLAVISTWIAYEVGLFQDIAGTLGIDKSGYGLFFDALRFRFYCFLMLAFVYLNISIGCDFGPMKQAQHKRMLQGYEDTINTDNVIIGLARCALIPLLGLLIFHFTALWMAGGGMVKLQAGASPASWVYWRETISDVPSSSRILVYSSTFGLILAIVASLYWGKKRMIEIMKPMGSGLKRALTPAMILILAWSIKGCCDKLQTGEFLSSLLVGSIKPIYFPALVFLVACLTSFATGTSYGTMAILIPTAIPVAYGLDGYQYGLITMMCLGAVLDGAIFGDHCSPISDTTILSSMSTGCDLMQHVYTQLPYGLLIAVLALGCAYVPSAMGLSSLGGIGSAILIIVVLLTLLRKFGRSRTFNVQ